MANPAVAFAPIWAENIPAPSSSKAKISRARMYFQTTPMFPASMPRSIRSAMQRGIIISIITSMTEKKMVIHELFCVPADFPVMFGSK